MERRETLSVRFPIALHSHVRKVKDEDESLNDFVVDAVDREIRRRRGLQAYADVMRIRDKVKTRTGLHPDSVPLIRALREGEGRRD